MQKKKGFQRPKKLIDIKEAEAFIAGAEEKKTKVIEKKKPPQKKMLWDKGNERVMKGYNFRMNEVLWLKIKYITDHSPLSIQKFLESAVVPAVDKEIKKILK